MTGSQDEGETLEQTAVREVAEETGLDARRYDLRDWQLQNEYEIFPEWRWRYAPGVTHNTEHVFGLHAAAPAGGAPGAARAPAVRVAALARRPPSAASRGATREAIRRLAHASD